MPHSPGSDDESPSGAEASQTSLPRAGTPLNPFRDARHPLAFTVLYALVLISALALVILALPSRTALQIVPLAVVWIGLLYAESQPVSLPSGGSFD